jgi:hypothetical protein
VACVVLREALAKEYVTEVSIAVHAAHLCPVAVLVSNTSDRTWDFLIEAWPTAA